MSLTCIILTYNESIHIKRAIDNVLTFCDRVIVVDSYSNDETKFICSKENVDFYQNPFVTQSQQFEWALNNCNLTSEWILRLDADEYFDDILIHNIIENIKINLPEINGFVLNRKHIFMGKWVRFGGRYPLPMLRVFRNGTAHIEQKWMDEHIVLDIGETKVIKGDFFDDNLNSVSWFIDKHNKYATREVVDIMLKRIKPDHSYEIPKGTGFSIRFKRFLKDSLYMKLPYFFRPSLYFIYRYLFQLGFLDGARGFAYHFMQAFWYRCLVDLKCLEVEKSWVDCCTDIERIEVLELLTGYKLSDK